MTASLTEYYSTLKVAIHQGKADYPSSPPFDPDTRFPEYDATLGICRESNPAYEGVRDSFLLLGLDAGKYGTKEWNPLGEIIKPGDRVVIKPNFVLSRHFEGGNLFAIITHPSILRAVVDYAYKAIRGQGEIIIADTPQMDCNFDELLEKSNLRSIQELYREKYRFEIPIRDLRDFWLERDEKMVAATGDRRHKLAGDPERSVLVNLSKRSAFYGITSDKFYGADYDRKETISHHTGDRQEYMVSGTILSADVLISVPKLKVHKKVGATLNAKGLVGTCTNKNYLVHYTLGLPGQGGDQFPPDILKGKMRPVIKAQRYLYDALLSKHNAAADTLYKVIHRTARRLLKPWYGPDSGTKELRLLDGGNWHGNDSAWRMTSDLMKIAHYADRSGALRDSPQRKIFSVIDGIIGGENNGPLLPDEKRTGVVLSGFNPLAVDVVATRLMGFDWRKLKWISDLMGNEKFDFLVHRVEDIDVSSNVPQFKDLFTSEGRFLDFKPHPGWRNYVEHDGL